MTVRRRLAAAAASALALTMGVTVAAAAPADASSAKQPGTTPLAAVLLADGDTFDGGWWDYDVVTEAALAVLAAKPDSPVKVLTDGNVALTAFLPRDYAFRRLVKDITGTAPKDDRAAFEAVAGLGIDTVETVLLYHVVPGATVDRKAAFASDGAELTTAQGGKVTVDVRQYRTGPKYLKLLDLDLDDRNPRVIRFDINKGNKQIAHGIDRVLRPIDLP